MSIHSTAIVDKKAVLDENVEVGPYSVIGPHVQIGGGTVVGPHVVINGPTKIGRDNHIFQFASIGEVPQDKKFHGENSTLEIGDRNHIREFVTINRGTEDGGGVTKVGNDNWLMAYIHIAHDCIVGNNVIFSNAASLAGHVTVDDHAILGGFTLVHQFCHIGSHAFCGMGSAVSKDVPPYVIVSGNYAKPIGINKEGLKRRGFSPETIRAIQNAYKIMVRSHKPREQALDEVQSYVEQYGEVKRFVDFILASERGIVR